MKKTALVLVLGLLMVGCSTTQKEHGARNVQTAATINALGNVPGAGIVGIGAVVYDFLREKPKFVRSEGINAVILKRIPGYHVFYKNGLDKFKSGELMGEGAQKAANEKLYVEGKRLYLMHANAGNKMVFAFSSANEIVNIMTEEEMLKEVGGSGK